MRCYDVVKPITPRTGEGSKESCPAHPGSSLQVLASATDSPGRLPKVRLLVLGIRVFSFLEGKTLVTEITIPQGQEQRSDIQTVRPLCVMFFTLTFPILFGSTYPVLLGQRNEDTMLLHGSNHIDAAVLILQHLSTGCLNH